MIMMMIMINEKVNEKKEGEEKKEEKVKGSEREFCRGKAEIEIRGRK